MIGNLWIDCACSTYGIRHTLVWAIKAHLTIRSRLCIPATWFYPFMSQFHSRYEYLQPFSINLREIKELLPLLRLLLLFGCSVCVCLAAASRRPLPHPISHLEATPLSAEPDQADNDNDDVDDGGCCGRSTRFNLFVYIFQAASASRLFPARLAGLQLVENVWK